MNYALPPGSTLEEDIRPDAANIHNDALLRKSDSVRRLVRACRAEDGGRFEHLMLTFWRRNYFFNFSTPCI